MMPLRLISIFSLSLLISWTAHLHAQCPPGALTIDSAQDLADFLDDYPDCTQLNGNLSVGGTLTNVDALANLTSVAGSLTIGGDLINVNGLGNITFAGSNISITGAENLVSIAGLSGLTAANGWLQITGCPSLTSLDGLDNITTVARYVWIWEMASLQTLSGLEGLTTVTEHVRLHEMANLQSLDGLQSLTTVGTYFSIYDNPQLTSVDQVNALMSIGADLSITNNASLTEVSGFDALSTCHGMLISGDALVEVNGFESLETITDYCGIGGDQIESITALRNVRSLERCVLEDGATFLDLSALETVQSDLWVKLFDLTEFVGCDNVTSIGGDLILGTSLPNLPDFPSLESIGGMLLIDSRASLEILDGFNNLESVGIGQLGWGFDMYEHDNVTAVTGLRKLSNIEGDFVMTFCDVLTSIEGLQSLSHVGGSFNIAQNPSLTDCTPICTFVQTGTAKEGINVRWNGPDNSSPCWSEEQLLDECGVPLIFKEANLNIGDGVITSAHSVDMDIRELIPEELLDLEDQRSAVAADGVSEVLCTFIFTEGGMFDVEDPDDPNDPGFFRGYFEFPWGKEVVELNKKFYGFALYKAPAVYLPHASDDEYLLDDFSRAYDVEFDVSFENVEKQVQTFTQSIPVVAPPVVLVHGTYSNPETWNGPKGQDFEAALNDAGYKTFKVDYEKSNGGPEMNGMGGEPSSFADNKLVVWKNPNGIYKALDSFRTHGIAVTQADVVGHSLGGILPRVYASQDWYNPMYRRAENFMEGDINRLITIASTHFGSNLAEAQFFLREGNPVSLGPASWFTAQAAALIGSWVSGSSPTPAVVDQLPLTLDANDVNALGLIGRTEIPAHAITCRVDENNIVNEEVDPDRTYEKLFQFLALLFYYNNGLYESFLQSKLDLVNSSHNTGVTRFGVDPALVFPEDWTDEMIFRTMLEDALQGNGDELETLDGEHDVADDIEIFDAAFGETGMSDAGDPDNFLDLFEANAPPAGLPEHLYSDVQSIEEEQNVNPKFSEILRFMIFDNDHNDGVVRVESQSARLELECPECVTHLENVLHGFAPKYPSVHTAVINLLKGGMDRFNISGFPSSDRRLDIYYPSEELNLFGVARRGIDAICASGMVPDHARQFARVADECNVVIITRPVNPDGTELIARGASTKAMLVKPKSSNWGPQKGYLPRNQRYSKLWKIYTSPTRETEIADYSAKAEENIATGITTTRHLKVDVCNGNYWAYIDPDINTGRAEDEVVLIPAQPLRSWLANPIDTSKACKWGDDFSLDIEVTDCEARDVDQLIPLEVMASVEFSEEDGITPRYLTADYDLLMLGFYEGDDLTYDPPTNFPNDPQKGQITPAQISILEKLNDAVSATGYTGGDVSHHGPENQFGGSKFVDYPLTIFAPDAVTGPSQGQVLSISMGDVQKGFRDLNLKRYVNYMRRKGYDLYDNTVAPGWDWTWSDKIDGFELEDSPSLPDCVAEIIYQDCLDPGAVNISIDMCDQNSPASEEGFLSWFQSSQNIHDHLPQWHLESTLVSGTSVQVSVVSPIRTEWHLVVSDVMGNVRAASRVNIPVGQSQMHLGVQELESGMYTITDVFGRTEKFIRL